MNFFFHKIIYMSLFIVQITEIKQLNYSWFMLLEIELKLSKSWGKHSYFIMGK